MRKFRRLGLRAMLLVAMGSMAAPAMASTPSSDSLTVPSTAGQTVTASWSGTVPVGTSACGTTSAIGGSSDAHQTTVVVPTNTYRNLTAQATVTITTPSDNTSYETLQVSDANGNVVATSAAVSNVQTATLSYPAGAYTITVCPTTANLAPVSYTASFSITTSAVTSFADVVQFTPATVVDPVLFGGEPGFHFDPTVGSGKTSYVDWPVSSRQNIGVLYKSTDGGVSYGKRYADYSDASQAGQACLGRQTAFCGSGGGGDTQVDINAGNGVLYFTSQESLANQAVGASFDHGLTFPAGNVDPVAAQASGDVDRQWLADWKGTSTVFLAYHSPVVGEFIMRSDQAGKTGSWYNPSGANVPQIIGVSQSGALVADNTGGPNNHDLYVAYLDFNTDGFSVGVSTDGGATFETHPVPANGPRNFTKIFLDDAGNLYATWVSSWDQKTYLSTSLASDPANVGHPATKWSKAVPVSDASQHVTIFADGVAGSPGRIGITYYGSTANAGNPDQVTPGAGGWSPILAMSMDALCQWSATPCAAPTFTQSHIAHQINQDDNICTAGTTCLVSGGNRNLLDYFTPSLDNDGHIGVVWSDGTNQTKMPFVKVSRQATGPSLYAGKPDAHLSTRGNGEPDAAGDALYPFAGNQVITASNHPQLDLLGTSVVPRYADGNLVFTIKLADTADLAHAVPGGGTSSDGLTPLQQAKYLVRWDFHGNSYYVGANLAAGSAKPIAFSGTVNTTEALNAAGGTSTYGNIYSAQGPAISSVTNGVLTLTVPAINVGNPQPGERLVSVGSYTLLGPTDNAAMLTTAPIQVDSTPTFDYTMPAGSSSNASHVPSAYVSGVTDAPWQSLLAATGVAVSVLLGAALRRPRPVTAKVAA